MSIDRKRVASFFHPGSIAVVGAGERSTSSGGAVMRNLRVCGYRGRVIPVNPKGGTIHGITAVRSLREIYPPADLVAVLVRPESILDVAREAAASGHVNLLILPGGFAEAGPEGLERDAALQTLAHDNDLVVAGPNCAGLVNLMDPGFRFAATFFRDVPCGGPVALISQSGAVAEEMIAASHGFGIPLGAVVSVGNGMHLDVADYIEYLGDDPLCSAILLYVESIGNRERFTRVARRVAAAKPIVALIGGRTEQGRAAAQRHTGATGTVSSEIDALCREAGILRVASLRHLRLVGKVFGSHPDGIGPRALVVSNSGGPGVLTADQAVLEGLELVDLPDALAQRLRAALPVEAAVANPLDLLADARADRFETTLRAILEEVPGRIDVVLMIHVVPFMVDAESVVLAIAGIAKYSPIPMMHSMMGTLERKAEWFQMLARVGVPAFNDSEEMCIAAGMLARYRELRQRLEED